MERGFAVRLNAFRQYDIGGIINLLDDFLEMGDQGDFCFIIELGLIEQAEFSQNAASRMIDQLRRFNDTRFIISSTSFPSDFTFVDGLESIPIRSRQLFDVIRTRYNDLQMSYSDWGSTKPRSNSMASHPLPRIDFPTNRRWLSARSKSQEWSYMQAAEGIMQSAQWDNRPNVWGVQMIESTAAGDEYGINSPRKSASARINIHLFTQNHYEGEVGQISTDEPWQDL